MIKFPPLKVNQNKTFKEPVIKYKIYEIVSISNGNALLPGNKSKTLAEFKKKMLQLINYSLLKLILSV